MSEPTTPVIIAPEDLAPFAEIEPVKAAAMIEDAVAMAQLVAPCLRESLDPADQAAVKAILRGAIIRWHDAGSGAFTNQQASLGSASLADSYDNRQTRKAMFWPTEISQLQDLCRNRANTAAYEINTIAAATTPHLPWCNLHFGGSVCSCGAIIAGQPIYESPDDPA